MLPQVRTKHGQMDELNVDIPVAVDGVEQIVMWHQQYVSMPVSTRHEDIVISDETVGGGWMSELGEGILHRICSEDQGMHDLSSSMPMVFGLWILQQIMTQHSVRMEPLLYNPEITDTLVLHDPQHTDEDVIIRTPTLVGL